MRCIFASIFFLFTFIISNAQKIQKVRKIVPILPQQTFHLNGGIRSSVGGKSRTIYQIDLPKNTVEWFYTFSTSGEQNRSSITLNLVQQLTRLVDPTGITATAASAIISPTGTSTCDIYFLDRMNADAFLNKVDINGGYFNYRNSGSRQNFSNGTVQIKDITRGTHYLGFKNPSSTVGLTIHLEVAAIVEETIVNNDVWSNESKSRFYNIIYQDLIKQNTDVTIAKEISSCVVTKISELKTPSQYDNLTQYERESFIQSLFSICSEKYKEQENPEQQKALDFGSLGWKAFESGDIEKCIDYSKRALTIDNTLGWVKANLGLCYLIKGDELTSTDFYLSALSDVRKITDSPQRIHYFREFINDINNAKVKYPAMKSGSDIILLFQTEIKRN